MKIGRADLQRIIFEPLCLCVSVVIPSRLCVFAVCTLYLCGFVVSTPCLRGEVSVQGLNNRAKLELKTNRANRGMEPGKIINIIDIRSAFDSPVTELDNYIIRD